MTDQYRDAFREEAQELLVELEESLLELERTPDDLDQVGRVFRAMHTIKGSGAMFGFDEVAAFTHDVETVYDLVRNRKLAVTKHLVNLTLSACDQIRRMVFSAEEASGEDRRNAGELTASFREFLAGGETEAIAPTAKPPESAASAEAPATGVVTYRIRFQPEGGIFASGTNPVLLLNELRGLGRCDAFACTDAIPYLDEIDPEQCYTFWDIILTTGGGIDAVRDVFIFVEDSCRLAIDVIDDEQRLTEEADYKRIGEILVERGDITKNDVTKGLDSHKKLGRLLVESGVVGPDKVGSALAEQEHIREQRKTKQAAEAQASIRVPTGKLDSLVNMVGELVTVQSRLSRVALSSGNMEIVQIAEIVERLTAELRDNTMSIRMLPIGTTFSKFQRLVRDLSSELGKEIVLAAEGAETELDKTVIDRLNDPLVHLIRNSIDHGIEMPDARRGAGKPPCGTVRLSAVHSGANVLIRVEDDGAGLDPDVIYRKAVEKGLILPDENLTEKEIFFLIFAPGFSTAAKVTGVSGRGVGMDVVKKSIDALQGTIDIVSEKGRGTTVTLKLPLTLAIIDGLLVRIEGAFFVMPLSAVEECVELSRDEAEKSHGHNLASIRGEIVPYVRLRDRFRIEGTPPPIEQIVTTGIDGYRVGLVVDEVIGEHQTVIKSLGRIYRSVQEVSGATILGDGKVALILDLPKLVRNAEMDEKARHRERRVN